MAIERAEAMLRRKIDAKMEVWTKDHPEPATVRFGGLMAIAVEDAQFRRALVAKAVIEEESPYGKSLRIDEDFLREHCKAAERAAAGVEKEYKCWENWRDEEKAKLETKKTALLDRAIICDGSDALMELIEKF